MWAALFDDRFDSLAPDIRRGVGLRLSITLVLGVFLGLNTNWSIAGLWVAAGVAQNIWYLFAMAPRPPGVRLAVAVAFNRLAAIFASSLLWTALPVVYWSTGEPGLRVLAVITLASLLFFAHSYAFTSMLVVAAFGAAPATALVLLPTVWGGHDPLVLSSIVVALAMGWAYLFGDIQQIRANARKLLQAQDALRQETERAVAANNAKTAFLAMMSHELRTPMNGVLGMAQALAATPLDARQADHVNLLVRSGEGLMTILNDILDISKIEAGKLEIEVIAFDLHELGRRVHELWSEAASAKGVRLVYDFDPSAPRWVSGDPTRLRQVLFNLISNALKFTSSGEVRLSIGAVQDNGAADLEITVADTGLGISEAQQQKLFQSFVQADTATARRFGGTGLGLAICRQLTSLMGGQIDLRSRLGEGSSFRIRLRLSLAAPDLAAAPEAAPDIAGCRVLVVDDNVINQAVARAILEAVGAHITIASDGIEALEQIRGDAFDVVLMDIHMPRMGGLEALQAIRRGATGAPDLPVIALTADAMSGVDDGLMQKGFDHVVAKPIKAADLIWAIGDLRSAVIASPA
jgi:signal transduction histidine kinase/ActR/RegA family two-component response regulator